MGGQGVVDKVKKKGKSFKKKVKSFKKNVGISFKNVVDQVEEEVEIFLKPVEATDNRVEKMIFFDKKIQKISPSCDVLTGVTQMNCISANTAKRIKEEGSLTARAFLKEADNLATNIRLIGDKAATFMKQSKFGSIPIKKFQAAMNKSTDNKLSGKISLKYITNFGNCNTLIGILKFKCLVHVAILQIKVIGNVADKKIKNVASNSRLTILNLAVEVNKISGFKDISDNMVTSANVFKEKCYSLSEKLSRTKVATVLDIQRAASCQN